MRAGIGTPLAVVLGILALAATAMPTDAARRKAPRVGDWQGTTGRDLPVTFSVSRKPQYVERFAYRDRTNCSPRSAQYVLFERIRIRSDGSFRANSPPYLIEGRFSSTGRSAKGTATFDRRLSNGVRCRSKVSWRATFRRTRG